MADLRERHDFLLENIPEGSSHDKAGCPICLSKESPVSTYTEDELRVAVDSAVADLRTELESLRASQEAQQIDERISTAVAEAKTPLETQISELQAKLDAAVLEAEAEKIKAEALEQEKIDAALAAEIEDRKSDRLEQVKAVAQFPEEYLTENADRFAAMSDEDFTARLDEYKQIAAKAPVTGLPATTRVLAARQTASTPEPTSVVRELFEMLQSGADPRTF